MGKEGKEKRKEGILERREKKKRKQRGKRVRREKGDRKKEPREKERNRKKKRGRIIVGCEKQIVIWRTSGLLPRKVMRCWGDGYKSWP